MGKSFTSGTRFPKGQPEAQAAELDLQWEYIGEKRKVVKEGGEKCNKQFERAKKNKKGDKDV